MSGFAFIMNINYNIHDIMPQSQFPDMGSQQTWKMSEILPKQDCSFPDFTGTCVNYVNFNIATKQRNLSANTMFTTFTSLHG